MFFKITSVIQGSNEIGVLSVTDRTDLFETGGLFEVRNSTGNDGIYTVVSASFAGDTTTIIVSEAIPTSVVDGTVNGGIYRLEYSDTSKPTIDIPPVSTDTSTPLALVGYGSLVYGQRILENDLHIAENFANSTAPSLPLVGQHWYDVPNDSMKVWDGASWSSNLDVNDGELRIHDTVFDLDYLLTHGAAGGVAIKASEAVGDDQLMFSVTDFNNDNQFSVDNTGYVNLHLNNLRSDATADTNYLLGDTVIGSNAITPTYTFEVIGTSRFSDVVDFVNGMNVDNGISTDTISTTGTGTFGDNVSVTGTISSTGTISTDDALTVGTNATVTGTISVTGDVDFGADLEVAGNATVLGSSTITNTLTVLAGGSFGGALSLNTNLIQNVADPVDLQDVATKNYVIAVSEQKDDFSELNDVTLTTPLQGDTVIYDFASGQWINTSLTEAAQDATAASLVNGAHPGMSITYDDVANVYNFDIDDFQIDITGAVTGSVVISDLGDATIDVEYNAVDVTTELATAHAITATDTQSHIVFDAPTETTVAVQADATEDLPIGSEIFIRRKGAGDVVIVPDAGVTIDSIDAVLRLDTQHSCGRLIKEAADHWQFSILGRPAPVNITQRYTQMKNLVDTEEYSLHVPSLFSEPSASVFDVIVRLLVKDTTPATSTTDNYLTDYSGKVVVAFDDVTGNVKFINISGGALDVNIDMRYMPV